MYVVAPIARAAQRRVRLPKCDHVLEEPKDVRMCIAPAPVEPGCLVVLAVRVAVAALRLHELIAGAKHRGAVREHEQAAEVSHLPLAQGHDLGGDILFTLPAAVPTEFLRRAVSVAVPIGPVVLVVIRDQIVKREAVVRGDVVDALKRMIGFGQRVGEQVIAAVQPCHDRGDQPKITAHEAADIVPEARVPLGPTGSREGASQLLQTSVPRLGDQANVGQGGIGGDIAKDRWIFEVDFPVGPPREDRCEVKAEAIDVHLLDPVTQAVQDHLAHVPVHAVQRVARARVVCVGIVWIVGHEVVSAVIDPLEAVHRAPMVALGRVVVHYVENHLDVGRVQCLDHRAKLVVLVAFLAGAGILLVRRKEIQRHVAPVVALLWIKLEHRHQFDRRNAQILQVRDLGLHAGERAPLLRSHAGI